MKAMKKVAIKNRMMFFGGTAIVGVVGVFVFSAVVFVGAVFAAPQAHAYAIGSEPISITPGATMNNGSYDFGSSLQNLISPFTKFIGNLKWNNSTMINVSGGTSVSSVGNDITSAVSSQGQNMLGQWLSQCNNWIYEKTGIQLSGIFYVLLNAIAWVLGLAQQVVNWLLGLFH